MEKINRDNYREVLETIAEQNGLEVVNTTEGGNGYPIAIMPMLKGFESFEQFKTIASQYPQLNHFNLDKKDGWQLWFRSSNYFSCGYLLDDKTSDYQNVWYKSDKLEFINHAILDCFEVLCEEVKEVESTTGEIFLSKGSYCEDLVFANVEKALSVWEQNKKLLHDLEFAEWTNENDEKFELSEYIDFYPYNEKIKKYEEWFAWFDKQEQNKILIENLDSGRIEDSEWETCSYYYDTHTYAMALGVSRLSDLEIE